MRLNIGLAVYYKILRQCAQHLERMLTFLDRAEAFAASKNIEPEVFLFERLAPDMYPMITQIQSACGYAKSAAAQLSGRRPTREPGFGHTFEQARAYIQNTIEFMRSLDESSFENAASMKIRVPWRIEPLEAEEYLLQVILVSVYFHTGMAYAILRKGGVDVGKEDFFGEIYRHDA